MAKASIAFFIVLFGCFTLYSQDLDAFLADVQNRELGSQSLTVALRPPELRESLAGNGANRYLQTWRIIVSYHHLLGARHDLSVELGGKSGDAFAITQPDGSVSDLVSVNVPEVRLGYRYYFQAVDQNVRLYAGVGWVFSANLVHMPGARLQGGALQAQAMGGVAMRLPRIPVITVRLELPYTWMSVRRFAFNDGTALTRASFAPGSLQGLLPQFWPAVGLNYTF